MVNYCMITPHRCTSEDSQQDNWTQLTKVSLYALLENKTFV